jgi:hypothetical protein
MKKEKTVKISKSHYHRLLECASQASMLGSIGLEVGDWCRDPESTTYEAVLAMKAELYRLRADGLERDLQDEIERRRMGK